MRLSCPIFCLWALCLCLAPAAAAAAGTEPHGMDDMAGRLRELREQLSPPLTDGLRQDERTARPPETPPVVSAPPAEQDSEAWSRRLKDIREEAEKEYEETFRWNQLWKAAVFLLALFPWGYFVFYCVTYVSPVRWEMREPNSLVLYRFTDEEGGPSRWEMDAALPPGFLPLHPEWARRRILIAYVPMPPHQKWARKLLRKWKVWRQQAAWRAGATASAAGYGIRQRHIAWQKRGLAQNTKI